MPALKDGVKFIFFSDFDGTITQSDSNDWLTDNLGFGQSQRKQGNQDVLEDRKNFRDSFTDMMASVHTPFNECISLLIKNIKLDPGFKAFYEWSLAQNIPVVVLSSGMEPIIRALLQHMLGDSADNISIIANDVKYHPDCNGDTKDGWEIVFRHPQSGFGHDKSKSIRPYAQLPASRRPTLFYAGDGVSDLSAASETDLLFAKKGHDLVNYCVRKDMPFTLFEDWTTIHDKVKEIVAGKVTVKEAAEKGVEEYKREHGDK